MSDDKMPSRINSTTTEPPPEFDEWMKINRTKSMAPPGMDEDLERRMYNLTTFPPEMNDAHRLPPSAIAFPPEIPDDRLSGKNKNKQNPPTGLVGRMELDPNETTVPPGIDEFPPSATYVSDQLSSSGMDEEQEWMMNSSNATTSLPEMYEEMKSYPRPKPRPPNSG